MEWLEVIRWPVVVLFSILFFRKQIARGIEKITHFSVSKDGFSASMLSAPEYPSGKTEQKHQTVHEDDSFINAQYLSVGNQGEVFFDYSNNNGLYTIKGDKGRFDTRWSKASNEHIYFYKDHPNIKSVRLVKNKREFTNLNPYQYDSSSRVRTVGINQIAIFENSKGDFLAVKVLGLKNDTRGEIGRASCRERV